MKRLTILTVIAMVTLATSTGCRTCGSFMNNWTRADACSTCDAGTYGAPQAGYGQGMVYEGDMLLPAPTEVTHGPVEVRQ